VVAHVIMTHMPAVPRRAQLTGSLSTGRSVQGSVLLCRQKDQPGIVGAIGTVLAEDKVNISFMTVCRTAKNQEAIMAIGIDEEPTPEVGHRLLLCPAEPCCVPCCAALTALRCAVPIDQGCRSSARMTMLRFLCTNVATTSARAVARIIAGK
jgi:hypothetical protein